MEQPISYVNRSAESACPRHTPNWSAWLDERLRRRCAVISAPYFAVIDADMQHDEAILPQMLKLLKEHGLDVVVG